MNYSATSPRLTKPLPWAGVLVAALLTGCHGPALRSSFKDFSAVYANSSNEQMLLNLARRANGHPSYFLQLGSIQATYQFGSSVGMSPGQQHTRGVAGPATSFQDVLTLGGTVGFSASEQPSFSFAPLSGSSFAATVFAPINPNVLFILYDQGVPVDELMRTMVQSIDFYNPKTGRTTTLVNIPDEDRPESFVRFLRLAGLARELQIRQKLLTAPDPHAPGTTHFRFEPDADLAIHELRQQQYYHIEGNRPEAVEAGEEPAAKPAGTTNNVPAMTVRLRTFESVLYALSNEQKSFEKLAAKPGFIESLPPSERQPVIRFNWENIKDRTYPPVVSLTYRGKPYAITDLDRGDSLKTWNCDVFILLNELFSQVALDPSKLPVQQLIQVH